jgi:PPM family protein phosphatase
VTVLRSGSATHVGRIRKVNQDLPLEQSNLYAVADGMGGHAGGEVAARVAVETLQQAFERAPTADGLRAAFDEANHEVWTQSQSSPDLRGMGTTLTAMALVGGSGGHDTIALANVGDSRAYVFSAGTLVQVTDDHSLAEERMRHGEMTEAEAAVHPQRHILTRALGVSSEVEPDMWELELHTGDRVLICSDGLSNEVRLEEMASVLGEVDDPGEAAQRLVDVANEHGGADNITVVVVDVQVGEDRGGSVPVVTPVGAGAALAAAASAGAMAASAEAAPHAQNGAPAAEEAPESESSASGDVDVVAGAASGALAPGVHLSFGSGDGTMLAESGPSSGEFFLGNPSAAPPLASSSTRVSLAPAEEEVAAEAPAPAAKKESRGARRRRLGIPRRITPRVIGFLILVIAVPVAAYFVLRWYAYDNYFVTAQGDQIVVIQGQPGGVLWFHPRIVDHTHVTTDQIQPAAVSAVRAGVQKPNLIAAQNYVRTIETTTTTSTTTTTTTTSPTGAASVSTTTLPARGAP